jgi:hypothetical protein
VKVSLCIIASLLAACVPKAPDGWQSMATAPRDGTIIEVRCAGPYGWQKLERWVTMNVWDDFGPGGRAMIEAAIKDGRLVAYGSPIVSGWQDVVDASTGEVDRNRGVTDEVLPQLSWRLYLGATL